MPEPLSDVELRVLGSLVEKAITTPEYYPLTLNALINACNQKSNREPVTAYQGQEVGAALERLKGRGLARIIMGGDSRVPKYRQYFAEAYTLSPAEEAVLCELMLRGPQTAGELRGRIERLGQTLTAAEVEQTLDGLAARPEPLATPLPRQAGRKETRYAHLLAGEPIVPEERAPAAPPPDRVTRLEEQVATLRDEVATLRAELTAFRQQFE